MKAMLYLSGFGWDEERKKVTVVEDGGVWDNYIAVRFLFNICGGPELRDSVVNLTF